MSHDYDNRAAVPDWADYFARWQEAGAELRLRPGVELNVPYGPHPRCRFDLFPARRRRGIVMVFIHGGYWQWNAKEEFAFLASPWLDAGVDVAMLGYPLAPDVRLPTILGKVQQGLLCIAAHCARRFGGGGSGVGSRLVVVGWSAGAHLAVSAVDLAGVDRVVCLSGIYDLLPLTVTPLNAALALDQREALALSPVKRRSPPPVPCLIGVGAEERPALRAQAFMAHRRFSDLGGAPVMHEWDGLNHYSILDSFGHASGTVYQDVCRFVW